MRSLQVRLTVWFAVSFVAVAAVFAGLTYHHIEKQLSRTAFEREQHLNRDWVIRGSVSEQEIDQIMTTIVGSSLKKGGQRLNPVDPKRVAALARALTRC